MAATNMSTVNAESPIKIGILLDYISPPPPAPWNVMRDFVDAIRLRFDETYAARLYDRPVELVIREVQGLPRGTVQNAIEAYKELVKEGCLLVIGPVISENGVPLAEYVNREGFVPTLGWAASEDILGEWTFLLSNGCQADEPYVLANIMAHAGIRRVGIIGEACLIGQQYIQYFRRAAPLEGIKIVGEATIAQTIEDVDAEAKALSEDLLPMRDAKADAVVNFGFGYGPIVINAALDRIGWQPKKYCPDSWEAAFMSQQILDSYYKGWVGLEQYDEENPVGERFMQRFEKKYGRRLGYFAPVIGHDFANVVSHALALAQPLSPKGVKDALEQVRMLPAAAGAPGTRISFGKWTRRGWMGAGYMVAREFDPKTPGKTIFRGRIGLPKEW